MTRSSSLPRDVNALRGRVRDLSRRCHAGGRTSFAAFEELASMLLHTTVLHPSGVVRLNYPNTGREEAALGGLAGPKDPVPLNDGRLLRIANTLFLDRNDARGHLLKVDRSTYQYQLDPKGDDWIFRYDYLRKPERAHPPSHLQLRADLLASGVLPPSDTLERVHFPTGRMALEGVIRLLIEQFGVPCNEPPRVWRPVLAEAEIAFLTIARRPLSGPAG